MKTKLSKQAIARLREHADAIWGTAEDAADRQLATDLTTLINIYVNSIKPKEEKQ